MAQSPPAPARSEDTVTAAPPARLSGLGNRFVELLGRKLSREAFAAEVAGLLVEAVRVRAVAVLVYDHRRERLMLLADRGLPNDGRAALGAGADCPWDIPLRGLHNRRISVIEAAQQNPFVPKALIHVSPAGLCIASLPLYYDYEPTAVVLLLAAGNRTFPDGQLRMLSQALRVCARGLRDPNAPVVRAPIIDPEDDATEATSGRVSDDGAVSGAPATPVPQGGDGQEPAAPLLHLVEGESRARLTAAEQPAGDLPARLEQLERELVQAREQIERTTQGARGLTISRQALMRERDGVADQLAELQRIRETEGSELRAQVAALEERLLAAESERLRYQRTAEAKRATALQATTALQTERAALQERLRTTDSMTAELQAALSAAHAERDRLVAQVEALTRQAHTSQETIEETQARYAQERVAADTDRDGWKEQAAALRAQLKQRGEQVAGLERDLRSTIAARDTSASALQAAHHDLDRLTGLAEGFGRKATEAEAARATTTAELIGLQRTLEEERSSRQHSEQALREELASARAEAEHLSGNTRVLTAEAAEHEEQLAVLRQAQEAARQAEDRWQRSTTALRAELTTRSAQLEQSAAEVQQLRAQRAGHLQAEQGFRTELAAAQAEAERLSATTRTLATEVAEREEQVVILRQAQEAARQAEDSWQRSNSALRAELATVSVQLEQSSAEGRQLHDERAALRAALAEVRQRASHADAVHATALVQQQTENAELRQQVDALGSERADLAKRLQRLLDEGQGGARRLAETQQRSDELTELLRQRDAVIASAATERQRLATQVATLTRALRADRETLAQVQARAPEERAAVEAERNRWTEHASELQTELAQRAEKLATLEHDLHSAVATRDAERAAAHAEQNRLTALADELHQTASDLEAARAAAAAEGATLRQTLEAEHATAAPTEQALRADLAAVRTEAERLSSSTVGLRTELQTRMQALAERDEQLAGLRHEIEALRQHSVDRGKLAHQASQLRTTINDLERLLAAARGEAARAAQQRAVLAEQLEAAQRQQAEAEREQAARRDALERLSEERSRAHAERAAQGAENAAQHAALVELQATLERTHAERDEQLAGFRQEQEAAQLAEASWRESSAALRAEVVALRSQLEHSVAQGQQLRDEREAVDRQLALLTATRGEEEEALAQGLQAAREQISQLEQERAALHATLAETRQQLSQSDAAHTEARAQMQAEAADVRRQVKALTTVRDRLNDRLGRAEQALAAQAERVDGESRRAAALTEQCTQLEQLLMAAEGRRAALDGELAQARNEIRALQHKTADRGALAHQASELGGRMVELEQRLATAHAEVVRADQQRAAATEELDSVRRQQAEAAAAASQEQTSLRKALDLLTAERTRAAARHTAQQGEMEAQRVVLAELQAALDQVHAERRHAEETGQDTAQRLAETHRSMAELSALLRQRDAAIDVATTERKRLAAEVAKLTGHRRASQEALESAQGRSALDRATTEADRDDWKAQASAACAELDRLTGLVEELRQAATQLEAASAAAIAETTCLQRALDDARADHQQTEQALRADLVARQSETDQRSSDAGQLHRRLAERDAQLRQEKEAARQAEASWQQTTAGLRAEVATLGTRLEESAAECQQLRDQRSAVERQLALAAASRGEEEQALTRGLQVAREQIALLEQERATLRTALTEARQRVNQADAEYTAALGRAETDAADLRQQLAVRSTTRAELAEHLQQAQNTLAAQAARVDGESQRAEEFAERCAQLEQSLAAAEGRRAALDRELAQARAQVDVLRARKSDRSAAARQASQLGSRVTELEQQLAATRSDSERQRMQWAEELEAARQFQQQAAMLRDALQRQTEERERVEAETAERITAADAQRTALAEELEAARQLQRQAVAAAEREQTTLREALHRQTEERRRLEAQAAERIAAAEAQRATLAELQATLEHVRGDRERAATEGRAVTRRLVGTEQQIAELTELLDQRDVAIQTRTGEQARLEEAARAAAVAAAQLVIERDDLRRKAQDASDRLKQERLSHSHAMAASARDSVLWADSEQHAPRGRDAQTSAPSEEKPSARPDATLIIERSAPLGAAVEAATEPVDTTATEPPPTPHEDALRPTGELVVLDDAGLRDQACAALTDAGFEVTHAAATEASVDELARRKLKCIMLNLGGGAAAWRTLKALRERVSTRAVPILAYVMTPEAPAGFCFGRADFAVWPMDPERLIERLARLRPKLRRLLALSVDVDGMGRMREPLTQAGISTSIVLDGKQALEFASMVDPEAALLQLSPACPSVARALVGFRASEPTRDLPLLLLLDKVAAANEDTFFATITRQLLGKAAFQFSSLPEEIARLVG